jgi:hypothetical protein
MEFIKWILSLLSPKAENVQQPDPPPPAPKPIQPPPKAEDEEKEDVDFNEWSKKAAFISSTYEGKGGDYANVVGNFDGAFLTCGLLGLTWKYGNQVEIIDKYLTKYGPNKLLKLMPKTGQKYLEAVNSGEIRGASIVASWSLGTSRVQEPYKSELATFWSSPEMVKLQDETYANMMGVFAKKKCLETQEYFSLSKPEFAHYAYWWDQAVLNGQGKTVSFEAAISVDISEIMEWMASLGGYNQGSNKKNYQLWLKEIKNANKVKIDLFKMAYLRALRSRSEFQGTTMMRRGTLALGIGYVNDTLRRYEWA